MFRKSFVFFLLIFPITLFAQAPETDITGLWKGTLYNDTTQQFYKYEIAISEEKGKLSGFSHTWFILEDKQYYGVKKVKVSRRNGKIIVEDDRLIANNYPVAPAKGVRQLNVLELDAAGSVMTLSGPFTTNSTKTFRPLTGSIQLEKKNDYWQSALVPHLQELNLAGNLSFVKEEVALTKNDVSIEGAKTKTSEIKNSIASSKMNKVNVPDVRPITTEQQHAIIKNEETSAEEPGLKKNTGDTIYSLVSNASLLKGNKNEHSPAVVNKPPIASVDVKQVAAPASVVFLPTKEDGTNEDLAALDVNKRTTMLQQTVAFKSDSLQISLYDNGEVDGDTVSVLMNGNIIMSKERLSTNAVRKTIYIPQNTDTIQLVMYAENLGTIPPNTGLLVVKDGKDLYEIRFSGDLQKNAAIIFRRKKN